MYFIPLHKSTACYISDFLHNNIQSFNLLQKIIQNPIGLQGDDVGAYFHIKLRLFAKFIFLPIQKLNFHIPDIILTEILAWHTFGC